MVQKLDGRDTYTPPGAPQALGNCDSLIKHGQETDQVLGSLKTPSNSSGVDQLSGKRGQNLRVFVLNMRGEPLMPTSSGKAKHLLKQGKATVVKRMPFTIQLTYATGETKQSIVLGIDPGYKYVGFSAVSDKSELVSGNLELRRDIPKRLVTRWMYRRNRRSRLWHRPPRFLNCGPSKGWFAPSVQHKLDSYVRFVERLKAILPISRIIVEVANFDIQKIKDPDIEGKEYQEGEQKNYWNLREYILHRDNHTCQHCKGKKKDPVLQVHHINGRGNGATDRPEELLTLCLTCHNDHHSGKDIIPKKKIRNFKPGTFMTTIRWKLVNILGCEHTYGYITKNRRIKQGLDKSHANDAFIIARGDVQIRSKQLNIVQVRRNNRRLQMNRKRFGISIRRRRYNLQPHDLIRYDGKEYRMKGVHSYGSYVTLDDKKTVAASKVELITYGKGLCWI